MSSVRDFAHFLLVLLCALVGMAFELTGQGFMKCGLGCFWLGQKLMRRADQVVEYALYEDWN
jgi:hypothetical protein